MATIKLSVPSVDGLGTVNLADLYTKQADGSYTLNAEKVGSLEVADVTKMRSALEAERSEVQKLKEKLKEADGLDFNQAREALEKVQQMKNWSDEKKVQEQIKAAMEELSQKHEKILNGMKGDLGFWEKSTAKLGVEAQAAAALASAECLSVQAMLPHVLSQVRMRRDGDQLFFEVLQKDGKTVRVSPDPKNSGPMSISELVNEMKGTEEFKFAFKASGSQGTGATGGSGTGGPGKGAGTRENPTRILRTDKNAIMAANDAIAKGTAIVVENL